MQNSFTLHCIPWVAGASLLQDIRVAACASGLLSHEEMGVDDLDQSCHHALALSKGGRAIGCARITPQGRIERIAVMPHEQREQIKTALVEALNDYARQASLLRANAV
jgi:N-acetylglutamate synthase-like GNAT family acetyltransferase